MAITYILFSKKLKKFYTGSSHEDEVNIRLSTHNNGKVKSTKAGRPWMVIAVKSFENYTEARKHELFLKSGVGRKLINEQFGHYKRKGG